MADAANFLSRFAYVLVGLGIPVGAALHEMAMFVLYPLATASFLLAAILNPMEHLFFHRLRDMFKSPIILLILALLGWICVSLLWTPYAKPAGQHLFKMVLWLLSLFFIVATSRKRARATDLYLFPLGLLLGMIIVFLDFVANNYGFPVSHQRLLDLAVTLLTLLFPVMGGLSARGRNGLGRLLLILAFIYVEALDSTALMIALLVGFTTLSFAVSDLRRTIRDLSGIFAALMAIGPLTTILVAELTRAAMNSGLSVLGSSFATLARAHAMVLHEKMLLITGHGFTALTHVLQTGLLPVSTPRGELFAIWYELGAVGAGLVSIMIWLAFRAIGKAPARLAPYLSAALACNLTLATLITNFEDMAWTLSLGAAIIACDVAARSLYRTTHPSAAGLALF